MSLPNLSYMMNVGQLRYIQSAYEVPQNKNPDALIRHFLSSSDLWNCRLRGILAINRLRRNPFYYYVLARTKYYDSIYATAIASGVKHIVNIGSGSDTRAYRYADDLKRNGISCLECDQHLAITNKEKIAREKLGAQHVNFLSIDLNTPGWPVLDQWLSERSDSKVLVMLEGVSPYIDTSAFETFLRLMVARLGPQSSLAYDYKIRGVDDRFGQAGSQGPFRLSDKRAEVAAFHRALGFELSHFELGSALVERSVSGIDAESVSLFREDALLQMSRAPSPGA